MRRAFWINLVVIGLLGSSAGAGDFAPFGTTQPRLTVFEGFYNTGCTVCATAGTAVDQLATQYASQPVVFLEDDLAAAKGDRMSRYAAVGNGYYYPYIMVNSAHGGQSWTEGPRTTSRLRGQVQVHGGHRDDPPGPGRDVCLSAPHR